MNDYEFEVEELDSENRRSVPYEQYFGEMDINGKQKSKRKKLAEKIENAVIFAFMLILLMKAKNMIGGKNAEKKAKQIIDKVTADGKLPKDIANNALSGKGNTLYTSEDKAVLTVERELTQKLKAEISKVMVIDNVMSAYIETLSKNIVEVTLKHIDDKFYTSEDRAILIAENESNTLSNYTEYIEAVNSGKTMKKWIDMKDDRERDSHLEVGGKAIPIQRAFVVGESLMLYPKDWTLGAGLEEIANCRCTIIYY